MSGKTYDLNRGMKANSKVENVNSKIGKTTSTKGDYIAAKVNNYIPFQFRPKSWKILSNSIADFMRMLIK